MELVTYDKMNYHKACFKCLNCNTRINSMTSVAMIKSDLYCKNCFVRLFKIKGKYDIFGDKTLPQQQRSQESKEGRPSSASVTGQETRSASSSVTQPAPVALPTPSQITVERVRSPVVADRTKRGASFYNSSSLAVAPDPQPAADQPPIAEQPAAVAEQQPPAAEQPVDQPPAAEQPPVVEQQQQQPVVEVEATATIYTPPPLES